MAVRPHPFLTTAGLAIAASWPALALALVLFLSATNELYSFDRVTRRDSNILWGPAFSQMEFPYKLKRAVAIKPDILTLGSSRSNQFRAEMFPGAAFFNAAGASHSFEQGYAFLNRLFAEHKPKLVILTIDPWWFRSNAALDTDAAIANNPTEFSYRGMVANAMTRATDPKFLVTLLREAAADDIDPITGREAVGYRAKRTGDGYRPDGSVQYGSLLRGADFYYLHDGLGWERDFVYFDRQIRDQKGRFSYTGEVNPQRIEMLRHIVSLAQTNGVALILVLPPLAHALQRSIQETPAQRDYFARIESAVATVAAETSTEAYNFHDLRSLDVDDKQTVDGVHGDEIAYLALVSRIARSGATLAKFVDAGAVAALQTRMKDPGNRVDNHRIAP